MVSNQSDFTEGSILKKLVAFMMPILGALILQAAYGAVDLLVVGKVLYVILYQGFMMLMEVIY